MKKILITGAAGYIGSVLVEELLRQGYSVTGIDSLEFKQKSLAGFIGAKNFTFIKSKIRPLLNLKQIDFKSFDIIIPLAAAVGKPLCDKLQENEVYDINFNQIVDISSNVTEDQLIIFPNTNSSYGSSEDGTTKMCDETSKLNPLSLYAKTKDKAESYLLNYKKNNSICFRLATVFGPSHRMRLDLLVNDFTYKAYRDGYIVIFEPHFKRNYIHVRDVVDAFIYAINNRDKMVGQTFNLGLDDANLSKLELANTIAEHLPFSISIDEIAKDSDKRNYIVSNKKLAAVGFTAKRSIHSGIKELIQTYSMFNETNEMKNV